jgi:hypothetical protein
MHWGAGRYLVRGFVAPDATTVQGASAAASFGVNGFTREQACRALAGFMPWSFRLLVLRASDWVPEVRAAAMEGLSRAAVPDLGRHLGLVERLSADRSRNQDLDRLVSEMFDTPSGIAGLTALRDADDTIVRRTAWLMLMRWSPETTGAQLVDAAHDPDPWLRHWAMAQSGSVDGRVAREVARALRSDAIGLLRARGLSAEIEFGTADQAVVTHSLSDRSGAVRSVAQYHLKADGVDVSALYRARLVGEPDVGDVLGIGEVGEPSDADAVRRWLADPRARYRHAAVISSTRLAGPDASALGALLDDPSARVVHTAVRLLGASGLPSTLLAQVEDRAATGSAPVRQSALVLLRPYPWRWLLAILRCLGAPEEETRRFARDELAEWHRRLAVLTSAPPDDTAQAIRELLPSTTPKSAQLIEFALRTTTPR